MVHLCPSQVQPGGSRKNRFPPKLTPTGSGGLFLGVELGLFSDLPDLSFLFCENGVRISTSLWMSSARHSGMSALIRPRGQGAELGYSAARQTTADKLLFLNQSKFLGKKGLLPGKPTQAHRDSLLTALLSTLALLKIKYPWKGSILGLTK